MVNKAVPVFKRVYAGLYLGVRWFDDHKGLEPSTLKNAPESLTGFLTPSKTHGPDRSAEPDKESWLTVPTWWDVGFGFLELIAPYRGTIFCHHQAQTMEGSAEVSCLTMFLLGAMACLHRSLTLKCKELLIPQLYFFFKLSPRAPRSFMAASCGALGVPKDERDFLRRWVKTKYGRYVRVARLVVQRLQLHVALTLRSRPAQQSSSVVNYSVSTVCLSNGQSRHYWGLKEEHEGLRMLSEDLRTLDTSELSTRYFLCARTSTRWRSQYQESSCSENVQMLERSQSLLQYHNSAAHLQDWYSTGHGSRTPLQDDGRHIVSQTNRRQDV